MLRFSHFVAGRSPYGSVDAGSRRSRPSPRGSFDRSAVLPVIRAQTQTDQATDSQPRRFWGQSWWGMERSANPAPHANPGAAQPSPAAKRTKACNRGEVGTWDPAARSCVYELSAACL
jgi:hypothetical protein